MKNILAGLLAVLMLTGCAGRQSPPPDTPDAPSGFAGTPAAQAFSQPVYPAFPQMPRESEYENWETYLSAYEKYEQGLSVLRGEGLFPEDREALLRFAGMSTPLALAGKEGKNAVYSPLSLWSALVLLAQCAQGESRTQVLDALGAGSLETLRAQLSQVWRSLYTDDGVSSLLLSNSIWLNSAREGRYVQETLDLLAQDCFSSVFAVPMGSQEADQAVSDWISRETCGLISGPVTQTSPETLAILVSSLYYRAGWSDEFQPEQTEEDAFTDAAGQEGWVDFMHQTQMGSFLRREGYQAAWLNTQLGERVFVLPSPGTAPEDLLRDPGLLAGLRRSEAEDTLFGEIQWSVPKFDVESDLDLMDALAALGITDLQDPDRADLSALTDLSAFLSEAQQLARVKVDEEGVEAAAVTILTMTENAAPAPPEEVCVMDLDRPFLFVIYSNRLPLFVGVVNQM